MSSASLRQTMRRIGQSALTLAGAALLGVLALPAAAEPGPFRPGPGESVYLVLSDIHLDPFVSPAITQKLAEAPLEDWEKILQRQGGAFAKLGSDSNYALFASALGASAGLRPRPAFVLVGGDLLAHDFNEDAQSALGSANAAKRFATKTTEFVAGRLQARFPGVPVIPAIGNEDGSCGDYSIGPDSAYLRQLSRTWKIFADHPAAARSFAQTGSYAIPHPTARKTKLIVVNDVFFSTKYTDTCEPGNASPGVVVMEWLAEQLRATEKAGESAILLFHIPPGFDGYASQTSGPACSATVALWQENYAARFARLADRYRATILHGMAGHLHSDGFRIFGAAAKDPHLPIHAAPSISPIFGNNPGFTLFLQETATGRNLDFAVYYTQLNGGEPDGSWAREYIFSRAYDLRKPDAAGLLALAQRIEPGRPFAGAFRRNFQVSVGTPISGDLWRSYLCAQTATSADAFAACRCGG